MGNLICNVLEDVVCRLVRFQVTGYDVKRLAGR